MKAPVVGKLSRKQQPPAVGGELTVAVLPAEMPAFLLACLLSLHNQQPAAAPRTSPSVACP